ncbi:MAG: LysM peptidoglycan-binding domain-containing protein, partial [Chloroflexota bacterium]|nr:LysM peptidoglycan-binding domain-containing protein [Chloroflexota bacterium]
MTAAAPPGSSSLLVERARLAALVGLILAAGWGLLQVGGPPRLPESLPSFDQVRALLGGSTLPLSLVANLLLAAAWMAWLWAAASLGLELLLAAVELGAGGAAWVSAGRAIADRWSLPLARRAVAAAFALHVAARAMPVSAAPPPAAEQVEVVGAEERAGMRARPAAPASAYVVRPGDTLWSIAAA